MARRKPEGRRVWKFHHWVPEIGKASIESRRLDPKSVAPRKIQSTYHWSWSINDRRKRYYHNAEGVFAYLSLRTAAVPGGAVSTVTKGARMLALEDTTPDDEDEDAEAEPEPELPPELAMNTKMYLGWRMSYQKKDWHSSIVQQQIANRLSRKRKAMAIDLQSTRHLPWADRQKIAHEALVKKRQLARHNA
eukprot:5375401-Karenia_brevis.AAC.1